MFSGRGFPRILLGIFLRRFSCPVSGQLEKNAFRISVVAVRLIRDKMCALHPLQAEVDIVVTTLWLGHESL